MSKFPKIDQGSISDCLSHYNEAKTKLAVMQDCLLNCFNFTDIEEYNGQIAVLGAAEQEFLFAFHCYKKKGESPKLSPIKTRGTIEFDALIVIID